VQESLGGKLQPHRIVYRSVFGRSGPAVLARFGRRFTSELQRNTFLSVLFIEIPAFTRLIAHVVPDDVYQAFQKELLQCPNKGAVIRGSGGLRKARMKLPGRGRSSGARVIYLYLEEHDAIVLLYFYTKSSADTLSPEHLKRLRSAVELIKREFKA
jgi:mRNA-degrading endonuclease RelE of RelBE toxin-antitoxin system